MFNVMRGGIFADRYRIQAQDFIDFISVRNREVLAQKTGRSFPNLPAQNGHFRASALGQWQVNRWISSA